MQLWYPKAKIIKGQIPQGKYKKNYPIGAVVHFTSGRDETEQQAIDTLKWGITMKYSFFVISPNGQVYQSLPLDKWGFHCGDSGWEGLGQKLSDQLVGIEVCCAGNVNKISDEKYKAWFGQEYSPHQIREIKYNTDNQKAGFYRKYTASQEMALTELILWLKENNPEVFNLDYVLGHDEVSGPKGIGYWRKTDPGGSLSYTMPEYRDFLKSRYKPMEKNIEEKSIEPKKEENILSLLFNWIKALLKK